MIILFTVNPVSGPFWLEDPMFLARFGGFGGLLVT